MKKILGSLCLLVVALLAGTKAFSQSRITYTTNEYIARYSPIAIEHQEKYGIPASITLAQGILESNNGNGRLAVEANNHFGIKCKKNWTGMTISHDDDAKGECFRKYNTAEESYEDHASYLDTQPRYDSLFPPFGDRLCSVGTRIEGGRICYRSALCREVDPYHRGESTLPL